MTDQPKTDVPMTDSERDDLLNGGSGVTESPADPVNQGADPEADPDLLHGGSGEPE